MTTLSGLTILDETRTVTATSAGEQWDAFTNTFTQTIPIEPGATEQIFLRLEVEGSVTSARVLPPPVEPDPTEPPSPPVAVVPGPAALPLMVTALGVLGMVGTRRKRS